MAESLLYHKEEQSSSLTRKDNYPQAEGLIQFFVPPKESNGQAFSLAILLARISFL